MHGQPSREEMEDEQNAESSYPIVYIYKKKNNPKSSKLRSKEVHILHWKLFSTTSLILTITFTFYR